jgi:DNA-directed RNA polymerase subunit beta
MPSGRVFQNSSNGQVFMQKTPTKNFGKSKVSFPKPYLLSLQKDSWERLWKEGIKNLFREASPIRDYTGKEWELWFTNYKVGEPNYPSDFEAKENNDSYEVPLRVITKLVNLKTKEIKEQEVFLTDFPLMTERGTFIVNGVERVAVSQLIRSPGVFFTSQIVKKKNSFGAKIIPGRGAWLEFETDSSGTINVKIDKKRKIPATTLIRAFCLSEKGTELTDKDIKKMFAGVDVGETKYIDETLGKEIAKTRDEAIVEVYRRLRPGDIATPETAMELINSTFFNFARYDLSEVGRWRMMQRLPNQKKQEKIKVEDRILKPEDIVATIEEIVRLNNDPQGKPDQIDHLGNRRVKTYAEILESRLRLGIMRMERYIKDKLSTLEPFSITPSQIINPRPFIAATKEFFTSSQISQFMDNENPLAELEHKRRLTATGPGGLTRERAGFEARDVQPSHYGRICPIETPEGPNVGLVVHLATYARINRYGFIETPYFKVEKNKVTSDVHYLNAYEEEQYNIAHGGVDLNDKKEIVSTMVEARIKGEPGLIEKEKIDFIDVSAEQFISVVTSCIPFLQNDDANRALMGSNMQRQAVPLINPHPPLVSTGVEEKVAYDSGQIVISDINGVVKEVDSQHVSIKPDDSKEQEKRYDFKIFNKTNQNTCFHQKPCVVKGQKIKKGDVLCDGGAIAQGRMALGQNVLVAFISWKGLNFEDAIIVSERLVQKDVYTSIHTESVSCDVRETKLGAEITTSDIPNVSEKKLKDLDEEGIIRVGAEVGPNDILVGKISPKGEVDLTAEERLLKAIFGDKAKEVKDTSLLMEHGKRGRVTGIKIFSREMGHKLDPGVIKKIEVTLAETRKIQAGDKLAGRHGNKGVISKVLPVEDMPYLEDGTPVDIILNPLSVASRMNIGQILETHLGWTAQKLNYVAVSPSLSGANEKDIKEELKKAGLPEDGKVTLYDGSTGQPFSDRITVGIMYLMKLTHMVKDKIHMRSIGPYSLITQQPLGGKAQFGGQRLGEMEVWALEGYGAANVLQEMMTIKSDDVAGRAAAYESILKGQPIKNPGVPSSFSLLVNEIKALGLSVEVKESAQKQEDNDN